MNSERRLSLFLSDEHPCSYLEGHIARSEVLSPACRLDTATFSALIKAGFRRSGNYVYRPACADCRECIAVRVNVNEFAANRSQKRAWQRHENLHSEGKSLHFSEEHFQLYRRYQQIRHPGGSMDGDSRDDYSQAMLASGVDSRLIEFRENGILRMVSIIDVLNSGLSSVYTFYDPEVGQASFGAYNILWQIDCCRKLGFPWLYLGLYIEKCEKMAYKRHYQPLEKLIDGNWVV